MKGFVTKMEEGMGACDCIITKVSSSVLTAMNISGVCFFYDQLIELQLSW